MANTPLQADSAHDNSVAPLPKLNELRINGTAPFGISYADSADQRLAEAHAILLVFVSAHDCAEEAGNDAADSFHNLRHAITARALEGVATLIALAQHCEDCAQAERRQRGQA